MENEINVLIDSLKDELLEETQKVIRIKSIEDQARPGMPFGAGVNDALVSTLNLGERLGFKTGNVDGYMGYIDWGAGDETVGVLGHLDIVPEGDGWRHDPYGGEISDGKLFGRGTLDDKGPIMAAIYGMYALKMSGFEPAKKIRILLGTNEESGCGEIEHYIAKEGKVDIGFTPDGYFPVIFAEKGIMLFNITKEFKDKNDILTYIKGGHRPNMVPDYCEAGINIENKEGIMRKADAFSKSNNCEVTYEVKDELLILKSVGISAHGSTPEFGKNAIMQLLSFINSIDILNGEIGETIKFLVESIGMETNGKTFGVYLHDDVSGDMTFNVGTIDMNEHMISLSLNLRYPVTFKLEDVTVPFDNKIINTGFKIQGLINQSPLYFPKDHKLIKALSKVYEDETGQKAEPLAIGGGTYAKEMPNIVAFGPIFPGKPDLDHQANEYIEVEDLMKITKIYAHAIMELAK